MGFEFLAQALQIAMGLPTVGRIVVMALTAIPALSMIITTAVTLWHGVIVILVGLSEIPGLQKLSPLAQRLKADEGKVADFAQNKILPVVNRLSAIPLPQKYAQAPAPAAQAPVAAQAV